MAIRRIDISRDYSAANINSLFHKPDGTTLYQYDNEAKALIAQGNEYYINPEVNHDVLYRDYFSRAGYVPPGYMLKQDVTLYAGRVCKREVHNDRVMSDVWEDVVYCLVYSPETKGQRATDYSQPQGGDYIWVHCGAPAMQHDKCVVEVDAPEELLVEYERQETFRKAQQAAVARQEQRDAVRAVVDKGSVVVLVRGAGAKKRAKVDKKTKEPVAPPVVGKVFWVTETQWGLKVGIATTTRKEQVPGKKYAEFADVVWDYRKNVDVVGHEQGDVGLLVAEYAWKNGLDVLRCVGLWETLSGAEQLRRIGNDWSVPMQAREEALKDILEELKGI